MKTTRRRPERVSIRRRRHHPVRGAREGGGATGRPWKGRGGHGRAGEEGQGGDGAKTSKEELALIDARLGASLGGLLRM